MVLIPPLLNDVQKTADLVLEGTPYCLSSGSSKRFINGIKKFSTVLDNVTETVGFLQQSQKTSQITSIHKENSYKAITTRLFAVF